MPGADRRVRRRPATPIPQVSLLELVALDAQRAGRGIEYVRRRAGLPAARRAAPAGRPRARSSGAEPERHDGARGHRGPAGRQPALRPARRPGAQHRGDRRQAAVRRGSRRSALYAGRHGARRRPRRAHPRRAGASRAARWSAEPSSARPASAAAPTPRPREHDVEQVLVAGIGGGRRVAIPLASVTRLEQRARPTQVEHVGGREVVQYRGDDPAAGPARPAPRRVRRRATRRAARSSSTPRRPQRRPRGRRDRRHRRRRRRASTATSRTTAWSGSTVLGERVTELLDVRAAILAADPAFYDDAEPSDELRRWSAHADLVGAAR